ncbi:hypothetical protein Hanom_Chr06g00557451 [Helianthus anomalus]
MQTYDKSSGEGPDGATKQIQNLDNELYLEVGDLDKYSINYDRSGTSKGLIEVTIL